eukprot:Rmarinus@m.26671
MQSCMREFIHLRPRPQSAFTITQYNILAKNLCEQRYFPYAKACNLDWEVRKHKIVEESLFSNPDIVCLQELDEYDTWFKPSFEKRGFSSHYVKRPSTHVSSWSGLHKTDGCGVFFRSSRFRSLEVHSLTYDDEHDRVAMAVVLGDASVGGEKGLPELLVATTHIYWNAAEVQDQMKEIRELDVFVNSIRDRIVAETKTDLPIVICGDFNNRPGSDVYNYMSRQFGTAASKAKKGPSRHRQHGLRSAQAEFRRMQLAAEAPGSSKGAIANNKSSGNSDKGGKGDTGKKNSMSMGGATESGKLSITVEKYPRDHKDLRDCDMASFEPPFTTATSRRETTLDYIWYCPSSLQVCSLLTLPPLSILRCESGDEGWVQRCNEQRERSGLPPLDNENLLRGIPNSVCPSDHLPITATLAYRSSLK